MNVIRHSQRLSCMGVMEEMQILHVRHNARDVSCETLIRNKSCSLVDDDRSCTESVMHGADKTVENTALGQYDSE